MGSVQTFQSDNFIVNKTVVENRSMTFMITTFKNLEIVNVIIVLLG